MTQPAHRPEPGEVIPFPAPVTLRDATCAPRDDISTLKDESDYLPHVLEALQFGVGQMRDELQYLDAAITNYTAWGHDAERAIAQAQREALVAAIAAETDTP